MVVVRPSGIHGMGLFAARDIFEGETIGELEGKWVKKDGPHVLWVKKKKGFKVKNDMKYINHHDQPNAAYFDDLTVGALRDIKAGEEITHNYGGDEAVDSDGEWNETVELEDSSALSAVS